MERSGRGDDELSAHSPGAHRHLPQQQQHAHEIFLSLSLSQNRDSAWELLPTIRDPTHDCKSESPANYALKSREIAITCLFSRELRQILATRISPLTTHSPVLLFLPPTTTQNWQNPARIPAESVKRIPIGSPLLLGPGIPSPSPGPSVYRNPALDTEPTHGTLVG